MLYIACIVYFNDQYLNTLYWLFIWFNSNSKYSMYQNRSILQKAAFQKYRNKGFKWTVQKIVHEKQMSV